MKTFELKPLTLAMAIVAVPAFAQEANTTGDATLEEITVTGSYRASLAKALDQKRDAVGSKDTILAEDIADFPDLNLAESLQRIPGVAITRDAGEGRNIAVRGLGSQFTRVRINGLEAISTTGGADSSGGANRDRTFDFNTFASELFSNLTVHKTMAADLDEGSLGATVDLGTGRPLDMADDFTFAANMQYGYNSQSQEANPRTSFLVGGKNEAETFGWMASYSYSDRNILEEGFSTVRWTASEEIVNCSACADDSELAALNEGFFPRIPRYGKFTHEQERQGFTGTLQFRPTDSTEILVDYLTSRFDATREEEFVSVSLKDGGNYKEYDVTDYTMDGSGTITSMTVENYDLRVEHRFDELETAFDQVSIRASHDFTDRLRGDVLWGTSESNYSNPMQTTAIVDAINVQNSFTYNATTSGGSIDFADFDTANAANYDFVELRHRPNTVDNSFDTAAFNLEFDLTDTMSLKGGLSQKSFEFDVAEMRAGPKFSGISATELQGSVTSMNGISWFSPDVGSTLATYSAEVAAGMAPRAQDIRNVKEDSLGYYVQLDWNTEVAGLPLRGNVGVRQVTTEVESAGLADIGGNLVGVTAENEYDDTLPSLNLALDVHEDMVVRFSVADVMARPSLGTLTPGGKIDQYNGSISYGNPKLDPFRARAYDISYEWYFSDEAVFAAAYFYKDIDSFITRQTDSGITWAETGLDASALANEGTYDETSIWDVSRNVNGEGGELSGIELQYQQMFFDNYGLILNYTYVDSEMNYGTEEEPLYDVLTGMSKNTYNATVYYENEDWSARVSYAKRSDYLTQSPAAVRNGNDTEYTEGTGNIDFVASYNVNDNWKLSFEGINLTNEANRQMIDSSGRIVVDHTTGRQYYVGAQYKF
ncbi:TonB-dependent receptor [Microbulbifer sp. CAU 1566]|uniref:TonB-dependent receptor n=1 Tax=unclassified Microbulbifer TaxID=2619833 RepID=UPI00135BECFE|nr:MULTISPECIES: TonB-dependent receptor [unclassified Microbulbifer]MCK7598952.1 TonB-dependent receptor [Microbulbifer sp. CAU 1566]